MEVLRFSLGQLQTNCYFVVQNGGCLLIDPADEASFILEEIQRRKLKLVRIYATHGHFDHVMAAGEMPQSLHIHKNDIFLLKRLAATATYFLGYDPIIIEPVDIKFITPVKKRRVGDFEFEVIHTPGHTPGSVCFLFPKEKKIFTGDLLFKNGIGRYDFSYGNKIELFESLEKIWRLPPEITIYPGHGDKTTVALSRF